jgi:hypothetical protein
MASKPKKDYQAIAAKKIQKPSQQTRLPKLHIYGGHKKGKTTFCMSAGIDKVLILDPERGTDPFVKKDPDVWHITEWPEVDEFYQYVRGGNHKYEWVALDGLTKLSAMALRYVMKVAEERNLDRQPGMVDRRDYGKAGELMRQTLTNFHNLPYGVIYTSHERMIEIEQEEDEDEDAEGAAAMFVPDSAQGRSRDGQLAGRCNRPDICGERGGERSRQEATPTLDRGVGQVRHRVSVRLRTPPGHGEGTHRAQIGPSNPDGLHTSRVIRLGKER